MAPIELPRVYDGETSQDGFSVIMYVCLLVELPENIDQCR